jgi:putative hemin transport protein
MIENLSQRIARHKLENPHAHARDVALALGVSEAELVASRCGEGVVALDARYKELVEGLVSLGSVKTMTRNGTAVIERWGAFETVEIEGAMGQVAGEEIDLRLFLRSWRQVCAVEALSASGVRRSVQIFDAHGASVHKIYLEDESKLEAFQALVELHRAEPSSAAIEPLPAPKAELRDDEIDVAGLHAGWDARANTHEFFILLRRFNVSRSQALRLGGRDRAHPVAVSSLEPALRLAADTQLPIMIFVGNRGLIQIHTGTIRNVQRMHGWLNVLDPRFNLHVREETIASAWVVRKPTSDGIVTSFELYDAAGENVLLMFGKRKPGAVEDPRWRELVAGFPDAQEQATPSASGAQ